MKKILFPILAIAVLLVSSCTKEAETTLLTINFIPEFNDEAFDLAKTYNFDGKDISFDLYTTFLSDLSLIKDDGTVVPLSEIDYLGFSSSTTPGAVITRTYEDIEKTDFSGLRMGIGVKSDLNALKPSDYDASNPLSNPGTYWPAWNSYIFMRIQGSFDDTGDGQLNRALIYHIGSNVVYREVEKTQKITITDNHVINIRFDIHDLLMMNGQAYDISSNNETPHHAGDVTLATTLAENYSNMIRID